MLKLLLMTLLIFLLLLMILLLLLLLFLLLILLLFLFPRYDLSSVETMDPQVMKKEKKKLKNVALSFLLNLGGGVSDYFSDHYVVVVVQ